MPSELADITFVGENGQFAFHPTDGRARMPVGRYRVLNWSVQQTDEKGRSWRLAAHNYGDKGVFDFEEADEPNLAVGQPVISQVAVQRSRTSCRLTHRFTGRLDEEVDITCDGRRPPAPKIRITNADGSYNKLFSLEYG